MRTHVLWSETVGAISSYICAPLSDIERTKKDLLSVKRGRGKEGFNWFGV